MLFIQLRKVAPLKQHITIYGGREVYSADGCRSIERAKEVYTGTMLNAPTMKDTYRVLEIRTPNSYDGDLEITIER